MAFRWLAGWLAGCGCNGLGGRDRRNCVASCMDLINKLSPHAVLLMVHCCYCCEISQPLQRVAPPPTPPRGGWDIGRHAPSRRGGRRITLGSALFALTHTAGGIEVCLLVSVSEYRISYVCCGCAGYAPPPLALAYRPPASPTTRRHVRRSSQCVVERFLRHTARPPSHDAWLPARATIRYNHCRRQAFPWAVSPANPHHGRLQAGADEGSPRLGTFSRHNDTRGAIC